MANAERKRIRKRMRVRDLDGRKLGRVTRLHADAFEVEGGFPFLFLREYVVGYGEVRAVEGGVVTVARSESALQDLAAGRMPASGR